MMITEATFNWIMAHPWMTFFIALAAISAIESVLTSIAKIFNRKKKVNVIIRNDEKEEDEEED